MISILHCPIHNIPCVKNPQLTDDIHSWSCPNPNCNHRIEYRIHDGNIFDITITSSIKVPFDANEVDNNQTYTNG